VLALVFSAMLIWLCEDGKMPLFEMDRTGLDPFENCSSQGSSLAKILAIVLNELCIVGIIRLSTTAIETIAHAVAIIGMLLKRF